MPFKSVLPSRLYFSYGQFLVYDSGVESPGCLWTDAHYAQGFARRESTVCFGTLLEFGHAGVSHCCGPFQPSNTYERAIAVPFVVATGKVMIDGPDEINVGRFVELPLGNYRIVAAQYVTGAEEEAIELFFEKVDTPLTTSTVLVADGLLDPPDVLVETAEIA